MHVFYTPDIQDNAYVLSDTESKHAVRVLRVNAGDKVLLTDGKGTLYHAEVALPNPKRCALNILKTEHVAAERPYRLHIAIAPTKNIDRLEWFLEKATEIGIDEITPILSFHSERKVIKEERLEKVLVAAMKQSIKAWKPRLNPILPFKEFISAQHQEEVYIAHCHPSNKTPLAQLCAPHKNLTVLIGPEGDFSVEEVELAMQAGATAISLGASRLRTETAGLVACHTVNLLCSTP